MPGFDHVKKGKLDPRAKKVTSMDFKAGVIGYKL